MNEKIFKAYDVRGTYPDQINESAVERIAAAYVAFLKLAGKTVAVGRDVRLSSPSLQRAVVAGLTKAGANVLDIGVGPTELLYFAVGSLNLDGGIQVSASHNPAQYNGLKLIKRGVNALSGDDGLPEVRKLALSDQDFTASTPGAVETRDLTDDYLGFLTKFADLSRVRPFKVVANANFGMTGLLAKRLLAREDLDQVSLVELNFQPDGSFPKGSPNPQLPENRKEVSELVQRERADFAVSWDPDGDRCFFADENGDFIEGCHLTALFTKVVLAKHPHEKIIADERYLWVTSAAIEQAGGVVVRSKVGHAYLKNTMKQSGAIYTGEISGHNYFRDFYAADNGLIPFLMFLQLVSATERPVSEIFAEVRRRYPLSGEINFKVKDVAEAMKAVEQKFAGGKIDRLDGISMTFEDWRFNLRPSNTEPLLRLNVEALTAEDCAERTERLKAALAPYLAPQ